MASSPTTSPPSDDQSSSADPTGQNSDGSSATPADENQAPPADGSQAPPADTGDGNNGGGGGGDGSNGGGGDGSNGGGGDGSNGGGGDGSNGGGGDGSNGSGGDGSNGGDGSANNGGDGSANNGGDGNGNDNNGNDSNNGGDGNGNGNNGGNGDGNNNGGDGNNNGNDNSNNNGGDGNNDNSSNNGGDSNNGNDNNSNNGGDSNNGNGNNNNNGGGQQQQTETTPAVSTALPSGGTPHSKAISPPSSGKSHSHRKSAPLAGESVNVPLIVGVTTGALLFLILLAMSFLCCNRKKKNRQEVMNYYTDPSRNGSHMSKADQYYYSQHGPPSSWGGGPSMEYGMKGPPPPPGWHPPPGMMTSSSSSGMSSGYSSGPYGQALPPPSPNMALGFSNSTFTYEELAAATNGFSQANVLGQGGFGYVHKGVLANGKEIAVKSLKSGSGQGEREFQAEVEIISRVHHRHLVSLVGYCIAGGQRMLVYEFMPNNTLEFHLHGRKDKVLDFPARMKIALGSAKGLAYLHEDCHPKIIHRDIKTANILLDMNFEAMVADFGLAKPSSDNNTHISTRIMGTFGYLAPEYASSGKLTDKSDVFSFGVMLLELVTGRRPVDSSLMEDSLVDWATPLLGRVLGEGKFEEVVDPRLDNNFDPEEMSRLIACAAASVRHSARRRPKMSQIVRALEGDSSLEDLGGGMKPGTSTRFGSDGSETDTASYNSQMKKFHMMAMEGVSEDYGSSEYGGSTADYGRNSGNSSLASWDGRSKT